MKKIILCLVFVIFFNGCSSDSSKRSSIIELEVADSNTVNSKRAEGTISTVGEVDIYHLRLVEAGRILQIKCTSNTLRPDVDLLVTVFELDANGTRTMIAGTHAPDGAIQSADLKINLYVDRPKELIIHVRDLQDNESSDNAYFLSAHYEAAQDGNGNFENAVSIGVGEESQRDSIGSIGDIDCFSFDIATAGVYDAYINFEPITGTSIRLSAELYDSEGSLVETRDLGDNNSTHMVHYLRQGHYNLIVQDKGQDDFDPASYYSAGITQNTTEEAKTNDTPAHAVTAVTASFDGASIDYYEDIDWYKIAITASGDIDILELGFDSEININYRLNLYKIADSELDDFDNTVAVPVFSHDFSTANDPPYLAVLKLDALGDGENYYLAVMPQNGRYLTGNSPYDASVTINSITDPDEPNDTDAAAVDMSATPSHSGKIAYRGDSDWYKITLPLPVSDSVLSVDLDVPVSNTVEYAVDIIRNVRQGEDGSYGFTKTLRHTQTDYRDVDLNTGFIVPKQSPDPELDINDATYYIKVYDYQNDDGEDLDYTISWSIDAIPDAPAPADGVIDPVYNDERNERNTNHTEGYREASANVTMIYENNTSEVFRVNNTMLNPKSITAEPVDNVTTIEMPWVSGYIDYQGDEDWYGVDLGEAYNPEDTNWYYEIGVEIIAAGSPVEYLWEYLPDSNNNNQVNEGVCSSREWTPCNSVAAIGGDTDTSHDNISERFPAADQATPWVGSRDDRYGWKGVVFFRVKDFNFLKTDQETINPEPDNDWGFEQAYFLRVILTYHGGISHPPEDD